MDIKKFAAAAAIIAVAATTAAAKGKKTETAKDAPQKPFESATVVITTYDSSKDSAPQVKVLKGREALDAIGSFDCGFDEEIEREMRDLEEEMMRFEREFPRMSGFGMPRMRRPFARFGRGCPVFSGRFAVECCPECGARRVRPCRRGDCKPACKDADDAGFEGSAISSDDCDPAEVAESEGKPSPEAKSEAPCKKAGECKKACKKNGKKAVCRKGKCKGDGEKCAKAGRPRKGGKHCRKGKARRGKED